MMAGRESFDAENLVAENPLLDHGPTFPVGGSRTLQKTNIFFLFNAFLKCFLDQKRLPKMSGFVLFTVTVM